MARIGTHLFQFVKFVEAFGGWGSGMRRAIARWYNGKDADKLAYQLLKYRQRDGWSHRDLLRLAHVIPKDEVTDAMFSVTTHPDKLLEYAHGVGKLPPLYIGYAAAQELEVKLPENARAGLIEKFNLSWEMLPTEWLTAI